jgi:hypothetical protein
MRKPPIANERYQLKPGSVLIPKNGENERDDLFKKWTERKAQGRSEIIQPRRRFFGHHPTANVALLDLMVSSAPTVLDFSVRP